MLDSGDVLEKVKVASTIGAFAWRDQGRWSELRSLFAENASIAVSWYSGSIDGFIEASKELATTGETQTKHTIGVPRISICHGRALAETDIAILIRTTVGSREVDITSHARFFDRLQRDAAGCWLILSRVAIYEKDRIDPVTPSILLWLARRLADLRRYPRELKHLAYGLERKGAKLAPDIVTSGSSNEQRLKADALAWLGNRADSVALP